MAEETNPTGVFEHMKSGLETCLAHVLGAPGATSDGLHLSNHGHKLLAETLAGLFTRK